MTSSKIPLEWLPTLPRRYATTAIDALLVLVAFMVPTAIWPSDGDASRLARILIAAVALLMYEPMATGRFATLGQLLTGVRVRRFDTGEKIGLLRAYGRIVVKMLAGVLSFFVLGFTPGRRAIHDVASGSIVILASAEPEFSKWAAAAQAG